MQIRISDTLIKLKFSNFTANLYSFIIIKPKTPDDQLNIEIVIILIL